MKPVILHIEDDPLVAGVVRACFADLGFEGNMLGATTVREGLAIVRERMASGEALDLVLVDMELPDGRGLDVIRAIREDLKWATLPVLVLSGQLNPATVTEAYALGANCYLPKHPSGKTILDSIGALYRCWFEGAVLPNRAAPTTPATLLAVAVRLRTRIAEFYSGLARTSPSSEENASFWLTLALNEGNLANLFAFVRGQFEEEKIPLDLSRKIVELQAERNRRVERAEAWLKTTSEPSSDSAFEWALELDSIVDADTEARAVGFLFPRAPVATKALRERLASHVQLMATHITTRSANEALRRRALSLREQVTRLLAISAPAP